VKGRSQEAPIGREVYAKIKKIVVKEAVVGKGKKSVRKTPIRRRKLSIEGMD